MVSYQSKPAALPTLPCLYCELMASVGLNWVKEFEIIVSIICGETPMPRLGLAPQPAFSTKRVRAAAYVDQAVGVVPRAPTTLLVFRMAYFTKRSSISWAIWAIAGFRYCSEISDFDRSILRAFSRESHSKPI